MSNTRTAGASTHGSTPAAVTASGKLRTISQLEPSKFCDFIGEVSYHRVDHRNRNIVMVMTDYTDHPKLPPQEGDGRLAGILVTLWDEHYLTADPLNICIGQFLHLKNLCCKLNRNDRIELTMNGYRGRGFKQLDPIQILGQQDPQVASLRRQKARIEYEAQGKRSSQAGSSSCASTPAPLILTQPPREKPSLVAHPVAKTTKSSVAPTSKYSSPSNTIAPKQEAESPQRPISQRVSLGSPPPAPQFNSLFSIDSSPRTDILLDDLQREARNPNDTNPSTSVRFLKLKARVVGFDPPCIVDFSTAVCDNCSNHLPPVSKQTPKECKRCRRSNFNFEYKFMLVLEDELLQTYNVHVDNKGMSSLLGASNAQAKNMGKDKKTLEKLKVKLNRIGVVERDPSTALAQEETPYFDCFIQISRVNDPPRSYSSPDWHYVDDGHSEAQEDEDLESLSSQPSEFLSQKRRAVQDDVRQGKRPCRDVSGHKSQGLRLQGSEKEEQAEFRASLVYTVIKM